MVDRYLTYAVLSFAALVSFGIPALPGDDVLAAPINETDLAAVVAIQTYVDVSMTNTSIEFGTLNPGTGNNSNTNNPMLVTVNPSTNADVNITLKATHFSGSGYIIGVGNLTYHYNDNWAGANATTMLTNYPPTVPYSASSGYWTNITGPSGGPAVSKDIRFYLTVPSAQRAATYTSTITIRIGQGTGL